jgi:glycosyltransferase involved in cell wall biosynthesis
LHILMISDVYFPRVNGVSTSIQTFRRELARLGTRVTLVVPDYPRAADGAGEQGEAEVVRVPSSPVPFDPEDRMLRPTARVAGLISRRQCNELDGVIVPSTAMQDRLRAYGVQVPLPVLPTGIDLERLDGGDGARFRAAHAIAPGQPTLVVVGRVAFEKNLDFLLRVMARVVATLPLRAGEPVLVVCGEGPAEPALRAQARSLGIERNLRFVGYLDRDGPLLDCYRAGDLFVFASRTETQGLVLLEAMALGVPVVSTAVMGTRDVLREGEGATIVADDEPAFAARVTALLTDPAARAALASRARVYAAGWSSAATTARLSSWYAEVIRTRISPAPPSSG